MDKKMIIEETFASISHMLVRSESYPTPLPPEIAEWYCYLKDAGHSILSILKIHEAEAFATGGNRYDHLIPVSVKTVLRGYKIVNDFVVVDVEYDNNFGLITPDGDDEY